MQIVMILSGAVALFLVIVFEQRGTPLFGVLDDDNYLHESDAI
jgi:hypothetical protein